MKLVKALIIIFIFAVTGGCESPWSLLFQSSKTSASSQITVLTTSSIWTKQSTKLGPWGLEHDLLESFAKKYNYKIKYKKFPTAEEAQASFLAGQGDLLSVRNSLSTLGSSLMTPAIDSGRLNLVCNRLSTRAQKRIVIPPGRASSYLVFEISKLFSKTSGFELIESTFASYEVIPLLKNRRADCAILDSGESKFYTTLSTDLKLTHKFNHHSSITFPVQTFQKKLFLDLSQWIQTSYQNRDLQTIRSNYTLHLDSLNLQDRKKVKRAIRTQLSEILPMLKTASNEFFLPWHLIAAVAFQESHWNADATSPTGVRGIMQLTQATADFLGVFDRNDRELSLWGGSKYLRYLFLQTNPKSLLRDRLALTLASYNIGIAHLQDLQVLALSKGLNPDSWIVIHELLPLKANQKWESQFPNGKARGHETQAFVLRVMGYLDIFTGQ